MVLNYYISFKSDGVDKKLTAYPDGYVEDGIDIIYIYAEDAADTWHYFDIAIFGVTETTYTIADADMDIYYSKDLDNEYYADSGTLGLTKVGEINDTIEGTFSGTFVNYADPGDEIEITDGAFRVPRSED